MSDGGPPRLAERWLRFCLPRGVAGASVLGDVHEEYVAFRPRLLRNLWYVGVALLLGAGFLVRRPLAYRRSIMSDDAVDSGVRGRRGSMLAALGEDLRSAVRSLVRRPSWSLAVLATFALGIGVTTSIGGVVYGALLRPLPFPGSERLVRVGDRSVREESRRERAAGQLSFSSMSVPNFLDLRAGAGGFEGLEAFGYREYNVTGASGPQRRLGLQVSAGFGRLLGVRPLIGRDFVEADGWPGAPAVVLLGQNVWREQFGADASIVGRSIVVDHVPTMVVGVLPAWFGFPASPGLWTPFRWDAETLSARRRRSIDGVGRLLPGVSVEAGRAELEQIFARLAESHPEANANWTVEVARLDAWMVGRSGRRLLLFGGASLLVLLIACVNVANLGIARALDRRHELAVCAALGAGRARLARQFLMESTLLALAGGVVGLWVAHASTRLLLTYYASSIPRSAEIGMDGAMLVIGLGLALVAGVAAGAIPALQVRAGRLHVALREGGRGSAGGRQSIRHALVVVEVALAVMLSAGAGLVIRTIGHLEDVDLGIDGRGALSFALGLPAARYGSEAAITSFYGDLLERLEHTPGIDVAGATTRRPLFGGGNTFLRRADRAGDEPSLIEIREATPGFFATAGITLERGRLFNAREGTPGSGVVVINQALARALFPDTDPLGARLSVLDATQSWEIIGVLRDVAEFGPTEPPRSTVYWPYGSHGIYDGVSSWMTVLVRGPGEPLALLPAIREHVRALDPDLPIADIATLDALAARTVGAQRRSAMALLTALAVLALLLGAIGIYGLVAFTVSRRRRELGVRMALGASTASVSRLVIGQGLRLATIGALAGFLSAVAGSRVLAELLWEVEPADPLTLALVSLILLLTTLLACALPARRAARLQPVEALRAE